VAFSLPFLKAYLGRTSQPADTPVLPSPLSEPLDQGKLQAAFFRVFSSHCSLNTLFAPPSPVSSLGHLSSFPAICTGYPVKPIPLWARRQVFFSPPQPFSLNRNLKVRPPTLSFTRPRSCDFFSFFSTRAVPPPPLFFYRENACRGPPP